MHPTPFSFTSPSRGAMRRRRESTNGAHLLGLCCAQHLSPAPLSALPALTTLDVSRNLLKRLAPDGGDHLPPGLIALNASHNKISRVSGLALCLRLRLLNVSHNQYVGSLGHAFLTTVRTSVFSCIFDQLLLWARTCRPTRAPVHYCYEILARGDSEACVWPEQHLSRLSPCLLPRLNILATPCISPTAE